MPTTKKAVADTKKAAEKTPAQKDAEVQAEMKNKKAEREMYMQGVQAKMGAIQTIMGDASDPLKEELKSMLEKLNLEQQQESIKEVISRNIQAVTRLKKATGDARDEGAIERAELELNINESILQYVIGNQDIEEAYAKHHDEANGVMLKHLATFKHFK